MTDRKKKMIEIPEDDFWNAVLIAMAFVSAIVLLPLLLCLWPFVAFTIDMAINAPALFIWFFGIPLSGLILFLGSIFLDVFVEPIFFQFCDWIESKSAQSKK